MAEAITDQQALPAAAHGTDMQAVNVNPIDTFMQSNTVRHFGRLIGLALAVAIGTVVVLWSSEPNYTPLYSKVSGADAAEIASILSASDIKYKIDDSGAIMVAQSKAAEARLKLAAQGLPGSTTKGLEMLEQDQSLGTSQFIETARYNHALEAELARSVETIRSVESARVHLAMPKQSIFIRNRTKPSASVVTRLYAGRRLTPGQVDAIVHMISASIPMMSAEQVTVVDQFGRLLTSDKDADMSQTNKQFEYRQKLEDSYTDRIINLLQPIIGEGKVNAQVSAALDFSSVESTREAYDPERSVIRSEQLSEQETRDMTLATGIPGALSNQPPGTGTTDPNVTQGNEINQLPANQNRTSTRNYEVDRMISHTRNPTGTIQRLSVAVVVDSKTNVKDDGSIEKVAWSEDEVKRFESLVKEAIGFDQARGDSVSIINTDFIPVTEEVVEMPLWKSLLGEAWVWDLVKQVLGAIGLLIVYLMFMRPFLRSLKPEPAVLEAPPHSHIDPKTGELVDDETGKPVEKGANEEGGAGNSYQLSEDPDSAAAMIRRGDATHEQKIEMAKTLVMDDPARVANVMKIWVSEDQ
jgi:flagellar M-ring protein FliF